MQQRIISCFLIQMAWLLSLFKNNCIPLYKSSFKQNNIELINIQKVVPMKDLNWKKNICPTGKTAWKEIVPLGSMAVFQSKPATFSYISKFTFFSQTNETGRCFYLETVKSKFFWNVLQKAVYRSENALCAYNPISRRDNMTNVHMRKQQLITHVINLFIEKQKQLCDFKLLQLLFIQVFCFYI